MRNWKERFRKNFGIMFANPKVTESFVELERMHAQIEILEKMLEESDECFEIWPYEIKEKIEELKKLTTK